MKDFINNLKSNKKMLVMFVFIIIFLVAFIAASIYNNTKDDSETETTEDGETVVSVSDSDISEEILATDASTPAMQIGDSVLYIGVSTVQDIVDAGCTFTTDEEASVIDFSEDAYAVRTAVFTYGTTTLYAVVQNVTDDIAPLSESVIVTAYWDGSNIIGTGGITVGDAIESLFSAFGNPFAYINTESYEDAVGELPELSRIYLYVDTMDHATLKISVDRNTYLVNYIEITMADTFISDATDITAFDSLVEDFYEDNTIERVYYLASLDGDTVSKEVQSVDFNAVQVATLSATTYSDEPSVYLFVQYTAILEDNIVAYGAFVVTNPTYDAAGLISGDEIEKIDTVYASSTMIAEDYLGDIEYTLTTKNFSSDSESETSLADLIQDNIE